MNDNFNLYLVSSPAQKHKSIKKQWDANSEYDANLQ